MLLLEHQLFCALKQLPLIWRYQGVKIVPIATQNRYSLSDQCDELTLRWRRQQGIGFLPWSLARL